MRLAYFINQYPKVSHSFIRREILALEKLGYKVVRYALKSDENELVDPEDQEEFIKTSYVLSESKKEIFFTCMSTVLAQPINFIIVFLKTLKMGIGSDRGILRHIICLVESCVVLKWQRQERIEHIHAHFGTNSTTVVMLAHFLGGAGYSFTAHGPEEFDKPEFLSLSEKVINSRFVVVICSYGRSQVFRWIPQKHWSKVKIVHCGLDKAFFVDNKELPPNMGTQLVCLGRLCEQKGQLLLLESMKAIKEANINCTLILAGDGPMRGEVECCIIKYDLADRVKITGWISGEEVKKILLESRGLVLPSFAEGLPVAIMESLAMCRPVISTFIAGIPELLKNGKNGWLVPAGDVDALTVAIIDLLSTDEKTLFNMGKMGHIEVKLQHNIEIEAAKLAQIIEYELANSL